MSGVFVTGTDTGVGKTFVTRLLAGYLRDAGNTVTTQKWIETGVRRIRNSVSDRAPYVFKFPASPHLAARREGRKISKNRIKKSYRALCRRYEYVIVEGTGGALVPFCEKELIIDIVEELGMPALVVVGNKLGAINHTLLTVEALRKRKIPIIGIIFNNIFSGTKKKILQDNVHIISKMTGERILGELKWMRGLKGI